MSKLLFRGMCLKTEFKAGETGYCSLSILLIKVSILSRMLECETTLYRLSKPSYARCVTKESIYLIFPEKCFELFVELQSYLGAPDLDSCLLASVHLAQPGLICLTPLKEAKAQRKQLLSC